MKIETLAVHAGYKPDPVTKAVAPPIYQTVAYAFDSAQHGADLFDLKVPGNIYTRIMNPTTDVLEQRIRRCCGGGSRSNERGGESRAHLNQTNSITVVVLPSAKIFLDLSCVFAFRHTLEMGQSVFLLHTLYIR